MIIPSNIAICILIAMSLKIITIRYLFLVAYKSKQYRKTFHCGFVFNIHFCNISKVTLFDENLIHKQFFLKGSIIFFPSFFKDIFKMDAESNLILFSLFSTGYMRLVIHRAAKCIGCMYLATLFF